MALTQRPLVEAKSSSESALAKPTIITHTLPISPETKVCQRLSVEKLEAQLKLNNPNAFIALGLLFQERIKDFLKFRDINLDKYRLLYQKYVEGYVASESKSSLDSLNPTDQTKDDVRAFNCFLKAGSINRCPEAAIRMAQCYASGFGVKQDEDIAFVYIGSAASGMRAFIPPAQKDLQFSQIGALEMGWWYEAGIGGATKIREMDMSRDDIRLQEALDWYLDAGLSETNPVVLRTQAKLAEELRKLARQAQLEEERFLAEEAKAEIDAQLFHKEHPGEVFVYATSAVCGLFKKPVHSESKMSFQEQFIYAIRKEALKNQNKANDKKNENLEERVKKLQAIVKMLLEPEKDNPHFFDIILRELKKKESGFYQACNYGTTVGTSKTYKRILKLATTLNESFVSLHRGPAFPH